MVSIHDTYEYHNYINSAPPVKEFKIRPNTILDYIHKNHPDQYKFIEDRRHVLNNLNNLHVKYTVFLPMSDEHFDFDRYTYRGVVNMGTNFIVSSVNGHELKKTDNHVNSSQILVKDIKLKNGCINIIKNVF